MIHFNRPQQKYGRSDDELYLFNIWESYAEEEVTGLSVNRIIHFSCGGDFKNTKNGGNDYPKECKLCRNLLKQFEWCMPDIFFITSFNQKVCVFLGDPHGLHGKRKRIKKDEFQYEQLRKLGYFVFVFPNSAIEKLPLSMCRLLFEGILNAIDKHNYMKIYIHDNESGFTANTDRDT